MNWLRYSLIAAIFAVSYLLFLEWNKFQEAELANQVVEQTISSSTSQQQTLDTPQLQNAPTDDSELPVVSASTEEPMPEVDVAEQKNSKLISVKTDSLDLLIDTLGGDIVKVSLPKHKESLKEGAPNFILMDRTQSHTYVAQSGLIRPKDKSSLATEISSAERPIYTTTQDSYSLSESDEVLNVDLSIQKDGVRVIKRFSFEHNSNLIKISYIVENNSAATWYGAMYGQIRRDDHEVLTSAGIGMKPYLGAAITTPDTNYQRIDFEDIADRDCDLGTDGKCNLQRTGGWLAFVQHYFISAWVPNAEDENKYRLLKLKNDNLYVMEFSGPLVTVAPGEEKTIEAAFYAGPKTLKELEAVAPHLDLTLDFSWLWMIAKPLHLALLYIQGFVTNWGTAIILLTLMIKLIFFYPSAISYRSMAKMRKVQPQMAELKERYGDDKQKMSTELMKLYKKEKVSPFGGCLPIMLQMPVFIALYWTLMESVELRHAPFMFWIQDLSVKDPFFVLPLIMGATMFIQQKLNPTPPDPMQAKIMQMMPIFFTVLFLMFPAGLVLYWVVNNTLSITQQYIITRNIEKADS